MDWTAPIDAYCERLDASFWSEPLNAVSNLSFFIAAAYGLALWRRDGGQDRWLLVLSLVAAMVGTGSFLFHTIATRWAALADVIPIGIFIAIGFGMVFHRLVGLAGWQAILAAVVFMAVSPVIGSLAAPLLGSSAGYAPALLALLVTGALLVARGVPAGRFVLAAGLVFTVSIGFRMADAPLCASLPAGTHVGWHLLNGMVLALVIRAVAMRREASIG